ncbi:hypothetical protein D3C73_1447060 [compost metagenome]
MAQMFQTIQLIRFIQPVQVTFEEESRLQILGLIVAKGNPEQTELAHRQPFGILIFLTGAHILI